MTIVLSLAAAATMADAQAETLDIPAVKAELEAAQKALTGAKGRRARLAALGTAARAHERALMAFRDGLRQLTLAEARLLAGLRADQTQLSQLLGALQSLGRAPGSAMLTYPGGPVTAARSASLMAGLSPELQARVKDLRGRLDRLRGIRTAQQVARIEARGTLAALQDLRAQTAAAMKSRRTGAIASRAALRDQAETIGRRAQDIAELAESLRPGNLPAVRPFADSRGTLTLPVTGRVAATFGAPDPWGHPGKGLTIAAPAYAEVTAPAPGTIRFAGPLTHYGNVVILEPEDGWLLVFAGLGTLDREVGEIVLTGERLGSLGGPLPSSDEFLLEATTDDAQIPEKMLYLELRNGDSAIDPAAWFDRPSEGTEG